MAAIKMILAVSLAVFFFSQVALSSPSRWERSAESSEEDAGKKLKNVEAHMTVAVEDLKKGLNELFMNISSVIQAEMAKHPEASQMYNNLYQNVSASVSGLVKNIKDATATAAPASA